MAEAHNDVFIYDTIPVKQNERKSEKVFGKNTKHRNYKPPRLETLEQDVYYMHEGLGHLGGSGHFVETTDGSLLEVGNAIHEVLFKSKKTEGLSHWILDLALVCPVKSLASTHTSPRFPLFFVKIELYRYSREKNINYRY